MTFLHNRFFRITAVLLTVIVLVTGSFLLKQYKGNKCEKAISAALFSEKLSAKNNFRQTFSNGPFRITYVIDGDTILLNNKEKVRLIGIDAPEIQHNDIPSQRFGEEAKEFLKHLAEGKEGTLEYEPNDIRDKYGRLLAYVFLKDKLLNAEMIRQGYARVFMKFPFSKKNEFIRLENEARKKGIGIWSGQLSVENEKAKAPVLISWQNADKHIGEYCAVEGKIISAYNSGKACFLNFNKDYNHHLTVVIFLSDFDKFPKNPEKYYLDKKVIITGMIKNYKEKPEIILNNANQIKVLNE